MNYGENKIIRTHKEFFTVISFAKILGVDPSTVRRYIKNKKLIGIKTGRMYLIFLEDALNYVENLVDSDFE